MFLTKFEGTIVKYKLRYTVLWVWGNHKVKTGWQNG